MQFTAEISNQIDRFLTGKMDQGEQLRFQAQMQMDSRLEKEVEMHGYAIRAVQLEGRNEIRELLDNARRVADNPPDNDRKPMRLNFLATILLILLIAVPLAQQVRSSKSVAAIRLANVGLNGNLCRSDDPIYTPFSHINYYPESRQFFYVANDRLRLFPIGKMTKEAMIPVLETAFLNRELWSMDVTHNINLRSASFAFLRRVGYKPPSKVEPPAVDFALANFVLVPEQGASAEGGEGYTASPSELNFGYPTSPGYVVRESSPDVGNLNLNLEGFEEGFFLPLPARRKIYINHIQAAASMNAWLPESGQISFQ